ncbi:hypothetical protein K449DRAFT_431244 [Hypoxylon sp. EC38]|nr:hypothetical protein K449DRAFT_431244 [Hypoxylon sp. EC38]
MGSGEGSLPTYSPAEVLANAGGWTQTVTNEQQYARLLQSPMMPSGEAFRTSTFAAARGSINGKPSWPPMRTHVQSSTGFVSQDKCTGGTGVTHRKYRCRPASGNDEEIPSPPPPI